MPRRSFALALCLVVTGVACGDSGGSSGTDDDPVVSIELDPPATELRIDDLATPISVSFTATARFASGAVEDVTDRVTFSVDAAEVGDFVATNQWQSSNQAGGHVTVEGRLDGVTGTATIDVVLAPVIEDPDNPPPPGADDLFDPSKPVAVGDPAGPGIVYPAHETMFPINVYRILFQYDEGASTDVYRIHFLSSYLDMVVYTSSDRWLADETNWRFLARSNAGGSVEMTVAGVDSSDPSTVYESEPIELLFSADEVEGAIYYWSTSSAGVMKGVISEPVPEKFYTTGTDTTCVACHTVSRDGTRLAGGYGGETLQEVSVPDRDVLISADSDYSMGWSTFNPDGSLLLLASNGLLTLLDSDSGAPINDSIDLGGAQVTHPDWSPLGDYVTAAQCPSVKNKDVSGCSIVRIPVDSGSFGAPEVLVAADSATSDNNFFPKYSPDGQWIAYAFARENSKDSTEAELRMIPAEGGAPIVLTRANQRVGPLDGVTTTGSTMPTWAPMTHPGTMWLAFSSVRDYGKVLQGVGSDQLWIVAIDTGAASAGDDPSYAAFWLPLQDSAEHNHRAFWAHDPNVCTGGEEVCDGFDNDCDGVVDEECVD